MYTGGNVTLMVSDMGRSVQFYTETLGLELKNRWGDHFAEVQAPGLTIGLHPAREPLSAPAPGGPSIGLAVDDLTQVMETLQGRGVQFTGTNDGGAERLAFFADPDQTPLYLFQIR